MDQPSVDQILYLVWTDILNMPEFKKKFVKSRIKNELKK